MSMQPYSDEELNYFKFASIVLKEFPNALRSIFVDMWDSRVAPSSTVWDDSPLVRNILHNNDAPNTKIPTNNSFKEWDCTALFQATLYARTFALPDSTGKKKTLGELYLKGRKPVPGSFHYAVRSPSGDANETIALAIDQLRLLRNTLCHASSPEINKVEFDDYVKHAKDAFTALNFSTTSLERIGNMKESDFPTKEVEKLNEGINRQRNDFNQFLENEVKHEMSGIKHEMSEMKHELSSIKGVLTKKTDATESVTAIMKPLPHDEQALTAEAWSLGLSPWGQNFEKPREMLISGIYHSSKIRRSINQASILLVGPTGVGKSKTINHLLGTQKLIQFAKTDKSKSETKSTEEFIVYGSNPEYEVKDLPLGLVDTPGFGDTDGSDQDACNLLSIKTFFRTHPKMKGHYPNLIFVIVKATENRIKGKNSELGQSLRFIKELGLVDVHKPNVVAIMTFACGIATRRWSTDLEPKKAIIRELIFDTLAVPAPVVLLENCPEINCLELDGDYTRLPNRVLQPKNLYDACAHVLKENNDDLGLIILNSIFVAPTKVTSKYGHKVDAKRAKESPLDPEEERILSFLVTHAKGQGTGDPIVDPILKYIQDNGLKNHEEKEMREIAVIVRNLSFGSPPAFGPYPLQYIEYCLGKKISSTGKKMLKQKFNILREFRDTDLKPDLLLGQGYNIITDKAVCTKRMRFDKSVDPTVMKFNSRFEYGLPIPMCAKFEKVSETKSFMELFENDESYTEWRTKNLNVNQNDKLGVLMMSCSRAGCNKKNDSSSSSSTSEYSFLFEQRMFELSILGSYNDNRGFAFGKDFKSAVNELPSKYNKSDTVKRKFEKFFDCFGYYLVFSVYGGGSVEIKCRRETIDNTRSLAEVKACLETLFDVFDVEEFSSDDLNAAKALLNQSNCSWKGGNKTLHAKKTITDRGEREKWKASLLKSPTMLTSEMKLEPISAAVASIDSGKGQATSEALTDILEYELVPKERNTKETGEKSTQETGKKNTRAATVQKPKVTRCFPSNSVVNVRSKDGVVKQKKMSNLDVGDKVMGWDEKRYRAIFTEVIMFAHRQPDAMDVEYLKIALENGYEITLSANHLVMVAKRSKKAILAQNVKLGEILLAVDENGKISPEKVLAVDKVMERGVFCPITVHGNLIADNVLASCYASVQDHVFLEGLVKISAQSIAHFGLMPMRALHRLRFKWWRKIPNGQTIHPYLQWLRKLQLLFMTN